MAIYGLGAMYDHDVSDDFVKQGIACIGWNEDEAPSLYEMLRLFKIGDIVYIKTFPIGQGLRIKAVGIVKDTTVKQLSPLGNGIGVHWIWQGYEILSTIDDKYNIRMNTLYEEHNIEVQQKVLELLFSKFTKI